MPDNIAPNPTTSNAPNAVTNLIVTAVSVTRNDLTFQLNNAGREAGTVIERSVVAAVTDKAPLNFQPLVTVAANVSSYSDTAVQPHLSCSYRVRALSPVSTSVPAAYSNVVTVTSQGATSQHTSVAAYFGQWPSPVTAQPYPVTDGTWGI